MISRRDALKRGAAGLIAPWIGLTSSAASPFTVQDTGGSMPIFRGNAAHSNEMLATGPSIKEPLVVKWHFAIDSDYFGSTSTPPIVVDEFVYLIGDGDHYLYALDADTGEERWHSAAQVAALHSADWSRQPPLTVIGRVAYFGGVDHNFYAVDATSGETIWHFATDGEIQSFNVVGNTIYLSSSDQSLYAIDAATGEEDWRFTVGSSVRLQEVIEGSLFLSNSNHDLYMIDSASGLERWRFTPGGSVGWPTVADEIVYIHSSDQNLYAISAGSGLEQWRFHTGETVIRQPIVTNSTIYVSHEDLNLYALDVTGLERWHFNTGLPDAFPAIEDETVYAPRNGSGLSAIDARSGEELWHLVTEDSTGWPYLVNTSLYICSGSSLYAVETSSGEEQWRFTTSEDLFQDAMIVDDILYGRTLAWVTDVNGAQRQEYKIYSVDVDTGKEHWSFRRDEQILGMPVVANGVIYIPKTTRTDDILLYALANLPKSVLVMETTLRGGPSNSSVDRGKAEAGALIDHVGAREEKGDEKWIEVVIDGVPGWIPVDHIDPATLPPEGEIEYVYIPE